MNKDQLSKMLEDFNDYQETLSAIVAVGHELCWDASRGRKFEDACFRVGRKMDTSAKNSVSPNRTVTPDIVIQRRSDYGIVAEIKITLGRDEEHWGDLVDQIRRYDDSLKGWLTQDESIEISDIVLVTHYTRKGKVAEYIKKKIQGGDLKLVHGFALVSFATMVQAKTFWALEKQHGFLSDQDLDSRLSYVINVPIEKVEPLYPLDFYDSKPPVLWTMRILWDKVFNNLVEPEVLAEEPNRTVLLSADLHGLRSTLQDICFPQHDSRQPQLPLLDWVREAMDKFAEIGYAEQDTRDPNKYMIRYTRRIEDPKLYFAEKLSTKLKEKPVEEEQKLFEA